MSYLFRVALQSILALILSAIFVCVAGAGMTQTNIIFMAAGAVIGSFLFQAVLPWK